MCYYLNVQFQGQRVKRRRLTLNASEAITSLTRPADTACASINTECTGEYRNRGTPEVKRLIRSYISRKQAQNKQNFLCDIRLQAEAHFTKPHTNKLSMMLV